MEKYSLLEMKIDTKSFTKSLSSMSNELAKLKTQLSKFNILESVTDVSKTNNSTKAIQKQTEALKENAKVQEMLKGGSVLSTKSVESVNSDGTKSLIKDYQTIKLTTGEIVGVMNTYDKQTKDILSTVVTTTNEIEKQRQAEDKLANTINNMQNKLNTSSNNGLINSNVISDLQSRLNSINTDSSENEVKQLQQAINNLASSDSGIVRVQNAISNIENSLAKTKGKYGTLINVSDLKDTTSQIDVLKNTLTDLTNGKTVSSSKLSSEINKANNSLRTMSTNAKSSSDALRLTQKDAMSLGTAIQTTMGKFGIYASTAVAMRQLFNVIKDGVGYVKSLDEAFFNIGATMDVSKTQFKDMTSQVQDMAKNMGISAKSVMEVVQTYANATTDINEVLGKAQPSVILSNITGMSTQDVTKSANAVVNAFKMMDEEGATASNSVERFGDVITKISQNMQYDFGEGITEIISGIKESGNVAFTSGMSYESYASKLGAMIEATGRSGSELANGIKMIVARTFSIKELGEDLGITTEEFNKAGKALKEFDVNISNGDGSLKTMDEVLDVVASKWGTMTDAERNYLAESVAGNRQRSTFISLMNTMTKSTKLYNDAITSSGTMTEVQEKYLDSFNGKLGTLQATFESLMSNSLNSDFMKGSIDALSGFLNVLDISSQKIGVLPTVITGIVGAMTVFNAKFRENAQIQTGLMIPSYAKLTKSLKFTETALESQRLKLIEDISVARDFSAIYQGAGKSTKGFGTTLTTLQGKLALTTVGLGMAKVAVIGLQMAMSMLSTLIITGIISGFIKLADSLVLTKNELKELNNEFSSTASQSNATKLNDLISKYEKLELKLATLKTNTEEYKNKESELAKIQEQIIQLYPQASELIDGNTEAKRLNLEKTKELAEEELNILKAKAIKTLENNEVTNTDDIKKAIQDYEVYSKVIEKVVELNGKGSANIDVGDWNDSGKLLVTARDVETYTKRLEESKSKLEALVEATKLMESENKDLEGSTYLLEKALNQVNDELSNVSNNDMSSSLDELSNSAEGATTSIGGLTDEVKGLNDALSNLKNVNDLIKQAVDEFTAYGELTEDTYDKILSSGTPEMVTALQDANTFLETYNRLLVEGEELEENQRQAIINKNNEILNLANTTAQVVDQNSQNYSIDSQNHANSIDTKLKNSVLFANGTIDSTKTMTDTNMKNFNIDGENWRAITQGKMTNSDNFATGVINGIASMVSTNNTNYSIDASNFANSVNSKVESLRALNISMGKISKRSDILNATTGNSVFNQIKEMTQATEELNNAVNTYVGSNGVGGSVSHSVGGVGHGASSGGSGGSSSTGGSSSAVEKEIEDMETLTDRYMDLENAVKDYQNAIAINKIYQENASTKEKIALMEQEVELYKKQQEAIKNLNNEQKKEAEELRKYLSNNQYKFDSKGNITNANELLDYRTDRANNELTGEYKGVYIDWVKKQKEYIDRYYELVKDKIPKAEEEFNSLNNTISSVNDSIKEMYQDQVNIVASQEKEIANVIKYHAEKKYEEKKKALEKELQLEEERINKLKDSLNKEKELYNKKKSEDDYNSSLAKERQKLAEIQAEIDRLSVDNSARGKQYSPYVQKCA